MADLAKLVDDLSALSVREADELTKMLEEKWGVSAAAHGQGSCAGVLGRNELQSSPPDRAPQCIRL